VVIDYDLKDEQYMEYIEGLCLANMPIEFYGQHLRHLTVKEVLLMGEKKYSELILPFSFSEETFPEGTFNEFYLLDVLSLPNMEEYLSNSIETLKLFFDTDDIKIWSAEGLGIEVIINGSLFLDKIKFEKLREIILKICNIGKLKKNTDEEKTLTLEQINKIKDAREREYQMAIYENNNKNKKDKYKSISLYNVYNYVSNADIVDYEKPLKFNLYQLYNTFNINHKKENYRYTMRIVSSGMCTDTKKFDLRPLSQQIVK
jgi:hypothetical protein